MKIKLQIKCLPSGQRATGELWVPVEYLPGALRAAGRQSIKPGEVFEVPSKEVAREYLARGFVEVVL